MFTDEIVAACGELVFFSPGEDVATNPVFCCIAKSLGKTFDEMAEVGLCKKRTGRF